MFYNPQVESGQRQTSQPRHIKIDRTVVKAFSFKAALATWFGFGGIRQTAVKKVLGDRTIVCFMCDRQLKAFLRDGVAGTER